MTVFTRSSAPHELQHSKGPGKRRTSGGVFVRDDDGPRVELEGAECGEVVDALLDGLAEGEALALAGDDDDDLAGGEHGGDADGEGHPGDLGEVVAEEARVGKDGVVCERLDARARGEGRACGGGKAVRVKRASSPMPARKRSMPPASLMRCS